MYMESPLVYRNLNEIISQEHTALVIWDVQNALVNNIFNKVEFLQNIKQLLDAARKKKTPVIYSKITPLPRGYYSSFSLFMQMKRHKVDSPEKLPVFMKQGSFESEIPAEISPRENEVVLDKYTHSIFIGTHFERMMRNAGITTLLFSGISTEIGICTSARDAVARDFYTIVVSDCVSSMDREAHDATLKVLPKVCLVLPFADIVKEWV